MKRKTHRAPTNAKARNAIPPGWLTALAEVEAEKLGHWDNPAAAARRLALLKSFASRHGAALQSMDWGFRDVFGGLLDECCVFPWQGNALRLVDSSVDRQVLQADELRFTVRKEKYRDPSILRRPTRVTDPRELCVDDLFFGKGRACVDHTAVILALIYGAESIGELQRLTRLECIQ